MTRWTFFIFQRTFCSQVNYGVVSIEETSCLNNRWQFRFSAKQRQIGWWIDIQIESISDNLTMLQQCFESADKLSRRIASVSGNFASNLISPNTAQLLISSYTLSLSIGAIHCNFAGTSWSIMVHDFVPAAERFHQNRDMNVTMILNSILWLSYQNFLNSYAHNKCSADHALECSLANVDSSRLRTEGDGDLW